MFDLETAITDWKQSLSARESISPDDIPELETHLREISVASLDSGSLDEQERFLIAQRRIGRSAELGKEFAIGNPSQLWVQRLKWICIGHLLFLGVSSVTSSLVWMLHQSPAMYGASGFWVVSYTVQTMGIATFITFAVLIAFRRPAWIDRLSSHTSVFTPNAVLALLFGVTVLPNVVGLIWNYLYVNLGDGIFTTYAASFGFTLVTPVLLVAVISLLHRREQKAELA